jgi:outer membrane protein
MRRWSPLALVLVALAAASARAELKLGYVDLQRAIGELQEGKDAKVRLKAELERSRSNLEGEKGKLRAESLVLEKQAAMMSEEVRAQKYAELQRKALELAQREQQQQLELAKKEQEELKRLYERLDPIITALAQREGLAMVLDKSSAAVVYALPSLDLTDELVRAYNEAHPLKARTPGAPRK